MCCTRPRTVHSHTVHLHFALLSLCAVCVAQVLHGKLERMAMAKRFTEQALKRLQSKVDAQTVAIQSSEEARQSAALGDGDRAKNAAEGTLSYASVYRARANVYVLTDDFVDPNLARALDQKAADGFDIRVIVGPRFGDIRPEYSRTFQEQDHIVKYRINDADIDHVPSVVLVDTTLDRAGIQQMAQGYVLTHDMVATSRYFGSGASLELLSASDQLMDGNLIAYDDFQHDAAAPSTEIGQLFDVIVDHLDLAEEF